MDDVPVPVKKSKTYDGPEFVVTREFFNRYFEKPLATTSFHDLVNKARIIPWAQMRGRYLLNASLHRMNLPTVDKLPTEEPKRSMEEIVRFAFSLIDPVWFPAPAWLLGAEVIDSIECDHAQRLAEQHREGVASCPSPQDKLSYLGGVLDAIHMLEADEKEGRNLA